MFLYFNGDSHTEGAGLSDCDFFPDNYPGDFKSERGHTVGNNFRDWSDWVHNKRFENKHIYTQLRLANLSLSYPAQIQKLVNCEIYNNAVGGSSMWSIMIRTMYDLEILVKKNKIPDQVFIGLTNFARIGIPNDKEFVNDVNLWTQNMIPAVTSQLGDKWKNYANSYWTAHNDEQLMILYLYHCASIKYAVKSITGRDPIFLNTIVGGSRMIGPDTNNGMLRYIWNFLNFDRVNSQIVLEDIGFPLGQVADGHFCREAHVKYAEYVARTYLNYTG
jgi:hypothetical protein